MRLLGFSIFEKKAVAPKEHPADVAMAEAREIVDRINALYASGDLPKGVRFWFDLSVRPPRMTLERMNFNVGAEVLYK